MLACVLGFLSAAALSDQDQQQEPQYVWKDGKWVPLAEPARGSPAGEIALMRKYLRQNEPKKAEKLAEKFLSKYPNDERCQQAMLLGGRAEMARGDYYDAFEWFERQLARYPNGKHSSRALVHEYEIADAYLNGRKRRVAIIFRFKADQEGLAILGRIIAHKPTSQIAQKALMRKADYFYKQEKYEQAVSAYDSFIESYGKSPRAEHAALRAAWASYLQYRGEKYEDTPLVEAKQRFEWFVERWPESAVEARVTAVIENINSTLAKKIYATADFYRRTDKQHASIFYYKEIIRKYPDTEWAGRAEQSIKLIEGAREHKTPPNRHLEAIKRLFRREKDKPPKDDARSAKVKSSTQPATRTAPSGDGRQPDGQKSRE